MKGIVLEPGAYLREAGYWNQKSIRKNDVLFAFNLPHSASKLKLIAQSGELWCITKAD